MPCSALQPLSNPSRPRILLVTLHRTEWNDTSSITVMPFYQFVPQAPDIHIVQTKINFAILDQNVQQIRLFKVISSV